VFLKKTGEPRSGLVGEAAAPEPVSEQPQMGGGADLALAPGSANHGTRAKPLRHPKRPEGRCPACHYLDIKVSGGSRHTYLEGCDRAGRKRSCCLGGQ
jgi:hypothetical protein